MRKTSVNLINVLRTIGVSINLRVTAVLFFNKNEGQGGGKSRPSLRAVKSRSSSNPLIFYF